MSEKNQDTYNKGGFIAFLFSMVFTLLFFVYISFVHPGVELNEIKKEGQKAEQTLANSGAADAGASNFDINSVDKPWVENKDVAAYGNTAYQTNCAMCHGAQADGKGPAGMALVPKPRDLTAGKWTAGGTSQELFVTISEGLKGTSMAAFGHLPLKDRWAIVQYIRSVTKNKVKDDSAKLEAFAKSAK